MLVNAKLYDGIKKLVYKYTNSYTITLYEFLLKVLENPLPEEVSQLTDKVRILEHLPGKIVYTNERGKNVRRNVPYTFKRKREEMRSIIAQNVLICLVYASMFYMYN